MARPPAEAARLSDVLFRAVRRLFRACGLLSMDRYSPSCGRPLFLRQTQTALSAFWMAKQGFRLSYETPVFGYPWSIPFEFPIYQEIVALLSRARLSIDVAGRIVNFLFYIGTLYPLWILSNALKLKQSTWLTIAVLFLASPLYVYWSRTIMIESCALFFSVVGLALVALYLNQANRSPIVLVLAFVGFSLAALTKGTTYSAYAFLAGLLVLAEGFRGVSGGWFRSPAAALRLRPCSAFRLAPGWRSLGLVHGLGQAAQSAWRVVDLLAPRRVDLRHLGSACQRGFLAGSNSGQSAARTSSGMDFYWPSSPVLSSLQVRRYALLSTRGACRNASSCHSCFSRTCSSILTIRLPMRS